MSKNLTDQHSIAHAAFNAARKCSEAGGFLKEEIPTIVVAIEQLSLPAPAVKVKPIEWKEMTAAGHKPGSWPHVLAHMRDIAENNKSIKSTKDRIHTILEDMKEIDKHIDSEEWTAMSEERNRLVRYATFLASILDDVFLVTEAACSRLSKFADEEHALLRKQKMQHEEEQRRVAEQAAATAKAAEDAKTVETQAKPSNAKQLTPQAVHSALFELCHGRIKSLSTRYNAARRVMEIVNFKANVSPKDVEAIDLVIHAFVLETLEHDRRAQQEDDLEKAAWRWMKNTLEQIVKLRASTNELQTSAAPMQFYTTSTMEPANDKDIRRYSSMKPKIDYVEFGMNEIRRQLPSDHKPSEEEFSVAVNIVEKSMTALANESLGKKREKILAAFTQAGDKMYDELFVVENRDALERTYKALNRLEQMLEPWFKTWTGEEQPKSKAIKESPKVEAPLASRASDDFGNDTIKQQLARVVQGIEDGNVPTAQA